MFYRSDDDACNDAWALLNERFGHPSVILSAFKSKLSVWPKIGARENSAVRKFSDLLVAIDQATTHIPGLRILNDDEQNRRLLFKLPDWIIPKWGNVVAEHDCKGLEYPNFHKFTEFLTMQARIATRPVCSLQALHGQAQMKSFQIQNKPLPILKPKPSTVFAASSQRVGDSKTKNCVFCNAADHYLPNCPEFLKKSLKERREFVKEQKCCYRCLRYGHGSKDCMNPHTWKKCNGRHPSCLHDENFKPSQGNSNTENEPSASVKKVSGNALSASSWILPVLISHKDDPKKEKLIYALIDSQSDTTFIDLSLVTEMNLSPSSGETTRLKVSTLTSDNGHKESIICKRVSGLQVKGYNRHIYINLPSSYMIDHISLNQETIPICDTAKQWHHLQAVAEELPPLLNYEPGILIGFDCSLAFLPRECIAGNNTEPFALRTDLGWSIIGSTQLSNMSSPRSFCHRMVTREIPLASPRHAVVVLERDFENDSHEDKTVSQEDIQFLNILEGNIRKEKGQYKMPLPFKDIPTMLNNHCIALKRLNHLKQKLAKNKELHTEYRQFMDDMIERGDAERALIPKPGQERYIPHYGVFHPHKGKLRVVFGCSAKFQNTCLNDHLLVGPNLINSLAGVLYRFRQHQIAIICDIEKMFHQFKVDDNHRDFLRFLWWENGDISKEPTTYRMTAHLFGAASSPGCANFGLKYLAKECQDEYPIGAKFIKEDFYFEDGLSSQENEKKAIGLIEEAVNISKKGGLRLHKFASNSSKVMNQISPSERAANVQTLNLSFKELPMERTLGLQWSIQNDTIHFSFNPVEKPTTRRVILSTVASLYDPLGLIAPFVLTGKRILQDACHKSTKWDEPIPEELCAQWYSWKNDFAILKSLSLQFSHQNPVASFLRCQSQGIWNVHLFESGDN